MIEIINHGNCKTTYVKRCKKCNCKFRFEETDTMLDPYLEDVENCAVIECPECGQLVDVDLITDTEKE